MKTRRTVIAMLAAGPAALLAALKSAGERPPISGDAYSVVDDTVTMIDDFGAPEGAQHSIIFNEHTREILDAEIVIFDDHKIEHRLNATMTRNGDILNFTSTPLDRAVTLIAAAVVIGGEMVCFTEQASRCLSRGQTITMTFDVGYTA